MLKAAPICLASLAVTACAEPSVPVVVVSSYEDREEVENAFDLVSDLLTPIHMADHHDPRPGAVYLFVGDFDHRTRWGEAPWYDGCRRLGWAATPYHASVAHELGHLLAGPEHHPDPRNLLYPAGDADPTVTDQQVERARASARRLLRCR